MNGEARSSWLDSLANESTLLALEPTDASAHSTYAFDRRPRDVRWKTSIDGRHLLDIDPEVEALLGHPVQHWYRPDFWIEHVYESDRRWVTEQILGNRSRGQSIEIRYRFIDAAGRLVWIRDQVLGEDGSAMLGVMSIESEAETVFDQPGGFKARFLRNHFQAREDLSRRLAAEIHDDVGQILTVAIRETELARLPSRLSSRTTSPAERLMKLEQHLRDALLRVRMITSSLRPPALEAGLIPALRQHLTMVERSTSLRITSELQDGAAADGPESIQLFRIVQEALTNVIRHANATHVRVTLACVSDSCRLEISDNGRGFELNRADRGIGLQTIRERVELLGGRFFLKATPGQGVTVGALIPLPGGREVVSYE